jgi:hypothetical protein
MPPGLRSLPNLRATEAPSARTTTAEGKMLIEQIAEMKVPVFVLTGAIRPKGPDLFELIVLKPSLN